MHVLGTVCPHWRRLRLHESSPVMRGASVRLSRECPGYVGTQFFPDVARGATRDGWRCEDLEAMTFADESVDLHVTQDVFEHIFHPDRAFREIARTLTPGGLHVFTTPLVNKCAPTERCAVLRPDGSIEHLRVPEYHGNPVSSGGALVTMRWGYDICEQIHRESGLFTTMHHLDLHEMGIHAEYIEVLVTRKPGVGLPVDPGAHAAAASKRAVIFGAGRGGENARRFLADAWEIVAYADNDISKHGSFVAGIPVVPASRVLTWPDATVFVASVHASEMVAQLRNLGIVSERIKVLGHEIIAGR